PGAYGRRDDIRITWPGGTTEARVLNVETGIGASTTRTITVTAERVDSHGGSALQMSYGGLTPDELTELSARVAFLGEPNPLDSMGFLVAGDNPLGDLVGQSLSEDSFAQVALLLTTEFLVGERGVDYISRFRLG